MDITFNCDKCGQSITIDEAGAGRSVQCPKCSAQLTVPLKPSDRTMPAQPANMRDCPDCGRQISKRAASCPHCGAPLATTNPSGIPTSNNPVPMVAARSGVSDGFRIGWGIVLALVVFGIVCSGLYRIFVVIPEENRQREHLRWESAWTDIKGYRLWLEYYKDDNGGSYPTTAQGLAALTNQTTIRNDPWGHPYIYKCPGDHNTSEFDLSSAGPNGIAGDYDDIKNW